MHPDHAILNIKAHFDSLFDDVRLLGSGRAKVVAIGKGARGAVISVADDNKGWFVEFWSAKEFATGEEDLVEELVIELREDAIRRVCRWLDGAFSSPS